MYLYIDDDKDYGWYVVRTQENAMWVGNAADAYIALASGEITTVYLDMYIPNVNTADFAKRLKSLHPNLTIIVNTTVELTERERETIATFTDGYQLK